MNKILKLIAICLLSLLFGTGHTLASGKVDKLSVQGTRLVNEKGETVVLHGVSYGWHQFWPRFWNDSTTTYLIRDWGARVIRASMGVELPNAYIENPKLGLDCVTQVVESAIRNDAYVIIDWHSHGIRREEAIAFFTQMARRYKGIPNVIYEVFNEPVEDSWEDIKAYSIAVIEAIRAIEPDAVILVGCPHWDQDIHLPAESPITGHKNLMYTMHFYAATHGQWLRDRTDEALRKGIPVFVSECAGMEASGDGPLNLTAWAEWVEWMNARQLSWCCWSVSDKDETCSMLRPSASSTGYWNEADLKPWARIVRDELKK